MNQHLTDRVCIVPQNTNESFVFIHLANLCLLVEGFNPFIFIVIMNMYVSITFLNCLGFVFVGLFLPFGYLTKRSSFCICCFSFFSSSHTPISQMLAHLMSQESLILPSFVFILLFDSYFHHSIFQLMLSLLLPQLLCY